MPPGWCRPRLKEGREGGQKRQRQGKRGKGTAGEKRRKKGGERGAERGVLGRRPLAMSRGWMRDALIWAPPSCRTQFPHL